jgi:uncharacterized protein
MPGTLPAQAAVLVNVAEADLTFVDAAGVVRFFSDYRIFSRPLGCIDRDVLLCHREETRPGVERMLAEFRDGWRDEAEFVSLKDGREVAVRYVAVRDPGDVYLGCLEIATWAGLRAEQ